MSNANASITKGVHHVGLTVSNLQDSVHFYTQLLGWSIVGEKPEYPAIFVSDGSIMLTLWAAQDDAPTAFDKDRNVGLHHLAIKVGSDQDLAAIHEKLRNESVKIEFSPELLGAGPARHMMCYDPSGIRIEFICPGS